MQYTPSIYKLSNGLNVILDDFDIATTNVQIDIHSGANDETTSTEFGITHFIEHMLSKGTRQHPDTNDITTNIAASIGASRNAGTSYDKLCLFGRVLTENLNKLLELFSEQLRDSLFDPRKIEIERGVILDEYRRKMMDNVSTFNIFCYEKLFGASNLLGTPDTIKSFSREQLVDYFYKILSAQNMTICISGKIIDSEKTLQHLEQLFGWIPSFPVPHTQQKITQVFAHNLHDDQPNVQLRIAFENTIPTDLEHRPQTLATNRFSFLLGKKLHEILRNKQGLTYGVSATHFGHANVYANTINTSTSPQNIDTVIATIARECATAHMNPEISDDDVARLRMLMKLQFADIMESASKRCGKLMEHWHQYGALYDLMGEMHINDQMTKSNIIDAKKDFFNPSVSILTQGPETSSDLQKIWNDNFK
ncbi:MAG TPA: hypothetical protein DEA31_00340 [Alphaproteobacteria bacterium]|nr:hypothetical protein [Alphaproteobacteria bacterium]